MDARSHHDRRAYWDAYYAAARPRAIIPSQFAAFVASEYLDGRQVVELGCGNGRDALFFASIGVPVLGVDASPVAIEQCQSQARDRALEGASFLCRALESPDFLEAVAARLRPALPRVVYARFFLHAIDDDDERRFFEAAGALAPSLDDVVAVEFRTHRDHDLPKETAGHYRRDVDPLRLYGAAARAGFATRYFIEGFGYAKYRQDDAHVARLVLARDRGREIR
ncbi:MAG TPA: class I SAM-dependent methyltransferase [Anaeromyxobacter sp.]|nr:class I SAM-dependent methyltransferase [Anaeromyxobacter sp.]